MFLSSLHNVHCVLEMIEAFLTVLYSSASSPKQEPLLYILSGTAAPVCTENFFLFIAVSLPMEMASSPLDTT